jgi:hypothetical protein
MRADFGHRLRVVLKKGNLRVADLARWFEKPHATVSEWVRNNRQPTGAPGDLEFIFELLEAIEKLIEQKRGFPVPRLPPSKRIAYMESAKRG